MWGGSSAAGSNGGSALPMPRSASGITASDKAGSARGTSNVAASQLTGASGIGGVPSDASGTSTTIWNAGSLNPGVSGSAGGGFGGADLPTKQAVDAGSDGAATDTVQGASPGADDQDPGTKTDQPQPDTRAEASLYSHPELAVQEVCSAQLKKAGCKTCGAGKQCGVCGGTTCGWGQTCSGGKCQINFLTCTATQKKQARGGRAACSAC